MERAIPNLMCAQTPRKIAVRLFFTLLLRQLKQKAIAVVANALHYVECKNILCVVHALMSTKRKRGDFSW